MTKNWRKKRLSNLILLSMIIFYILVYLTLIVVTRTGIQWNLKGGNAPATSSVPAPPRPVSLL